MGASDNGSNRFSRFKKHILNISNQLKVRHLAKENNYDVIQVKDQFISAIAAKRAARENNTKFIYWLSYPFPEASIHRAQDGTARYPIFYFFRGHIFKFLLYRIILPAADHIFVQSEQMKKDIAAEGIPITKLTAVPMGVEIDNIPFQQSNYELPTNRNEHKILYLGTLAKVRKMDFLIRVFAKVLKKEPDAILYLVGAGDDASDEQILIDEAKKLGMIDSVIMTGFLPMEEAWEYVRKADVCVSPFYPTFILNSTSPTKLIEYMAMGKAVVANDHPEQRLVLEESSAGLCVRYDEDAFSSAIVYLLQNPHKAREMGIRGRRYVEQHRSYKAIADMVDQKYQQILKGM